MKLKSYTFLFLLLVFKISVAQDWKTFPYQPAGSLISFPKDEGRHANEPVEWWYISGHLQGKTTGKDYSVMISYFHYPALGYDGFRILNITDETNGSFFQDTKPVHYTSMATDYLDIQAKVAAGGNEFWKNKKDFGNKLVPYEYQISTASALAALDLDCVATKRPLILSEDGYFEQGVSNYTYYYSQTRNTITGTLTLNNSTEEVEGIAWIDRQYGDFNPYFGERYEWFHMQLSNGMDVNLWNIFDVANHIPDNSKYRLLSAWVADGTQYTTDKFKIERLGYNWMPDSLMCYADKWRVTSDENKIDVIITTKNKTTEVQLPFRFFEGATSISGTVNGQSVTGSGFAELLHSYQNPGLTINYPNVGKFQINKAITWQLINPDEGRPVTYDLEYSINNRATFMPVAQALTDTFYQWNNAPLSAGDKIWFKVTAHSIDGKLTGSEISKQEATLDLAGAGNDLVKWYPNPAIDFLYAILQWQRNNPAGRVIDASGRTVLWIDKNSLTNKVNISSLQRGAYVLVMDHPSGPLSFKFIKI